MKTLLKVVSICALAFALSVFARSKTRHFTIDRITSPLVYHEEWEFLNTPDVERILNQPFHFYDNGGQSWVFLSEDGQWILKFFDFRFTWHDLASKLSLPVAFTPDLTEKQLRRREGPIAGYALGFSRFRDSCGLVGSFLNGKFDGITTLTIYDPIHCVHKLDLKNTPFILQKRGEPLMDRLSSLLKTGQNEEASKILSQCLNLIAARCFSGIGDGDDIHLHRNIGFIGDEVIYLDAGTFRDTPNFLLTENAEQEVLRSADLLLTKISATL